MKRATITIPDDLHRELDSYLRQQDAPPSLTSVVQAALRRYLRDKQLEARELRRATGPFRITPAPRGSGRRDVSLRHDDYLTEEP